MRPEDEWVRYIPTDCAWRFPESVEGPGEEDPAALQWIAEAGISWDAHHDSEAEIGVHPAYVDCCGDHELRTYRSMVYPPTRDGVQALLAELEQIERQVLRPAEFAACPGTSTATPRTDDIDSAVLVAPDLLPADAADTPLVFRCAPAVLTQPHVLGMSRPDWELVFGRIDQVRRNATGRVDGQFGPRQKMSSADIVLAAALSRRFQTPLTAIAELYGLAYETVVRRVQREKPWLEAVLPDRAIARADVTLRTASAVRNHWGLDRPVVQSVVATDDSFPPSHDRPYSEVPPTMPGQVPSA
ncbi:hypothetical protein [Amycolatopsis sp. EV170708-02-1]|uniref:hypothetical protein n=1 Tax=Amycolatopsis sp. EV170708-02-1 TaxID=2919322 RepID=UPI001F0B8DD3|nr:hypothetical protein [Amycolatopsis sp. EV170708-02-1]UMP00090.1 hypothetical protein MJQ72_26705 [Amycolatopsis sp. EV170708-02-1]